jgi:hypothetical protein
MISIVRAVTGKDDPGADFHIHVALPFGGRFVVGGQRNDQQLRRLLQRRPDQMGNTGAKLEMARAKFARPLREEHEFAAARQMFGTFGEGVGVADPVAVSLPVLLAHQFDPVEDHAQPDAAPQLARHGRAGTRNDPAIHHAVQRPIAMQADVEHRAGARQRKPARADPVKGKTDDAPIEEGEPQRLEQRAHGKTSVHG